MAAARGARLFTGGGLARAACPLSRALRAGGRIESAARNERGSQRVRHGAPHPQGGPERDDLAEPPSGIPRQIDERGGETRIVGGGRGVVGGGPHGAGLGETALGGGQSVRPPRGGESVAPGGGHRSGREEVGE